MHLIANSPTRLIGCSTRCFQPLICQCEPSLALWRYKMFVIPCAVYSLFPLARVDDTLGTTAKSLGC